MKPNYDEDANCYFTLVHFVCTVLAACSGYDFPFPNRLVALASIQYCRTYNRIGFQIDQRNTFTSFSNYKSTLIIEAIPSSIQCMKSNPSFINLGKSVDVSLAVSRKNNFVNLCQNFKDGFRHAKVI
jgi:hypothetical protein